MSLAADVRAAVRRRPFLHEALRAGVVNYAAAARLLDVEGERSAVVAALRRYAEPLPDYDDHVHEARVTMRSGLGVCSTPLHGDNEHGRNSETSDGAEREADADDEAILRVGDQAVVPDTGTLTCVLATGAVDARALSHVLGRLAIAGIDPVAAGIAGEALAIVVARTEGPTALRVVESALDAVPG